MEDILEKIIGVCAFVVVILCLITLNFAAIMKCYGKITMLCEILKVIFCVSCLFATICIICLVIMMLLCYKD